MEHGCGGSFGRAKYVDGLRKHVVAFFIASFGRQFVGRLYLLLNFFGKFWRSVYFEIVDDLGNFFVGDEGALGANELGAAWGREKHVSSTNELFGSASVKDGATVDLGRNLERYTARQVGFDDAGDDVHRRSLRCNDKMDTGGASELGEAGDSSFDIGWSNHHKVGELVHYTNDVRELVWKFAKYAFVAWHLDFHLAGFGFFRFGLFFGGFFATVVACNVTHSDVGENLVAMFHFVQQPLESARHSFGVGNDWDQHMWKRVENLHFHDLRVDHDESEDVGTGVEKERCNDRIDTNGLSRARCPCDKQVGHFREIGNDRFAAHVFAESDWDLGFGIGPVFGLEDFANTDGGWELVGHFDSHAPFSRNRSEDTYGLGTHAEGDILVEARDLFYPYSWRGIDFVTRDDRADVDLAHRDFDAKFFKRLLKTFGVGGVLFLRV